MHTPPGPESPPVATPGHDRLTGLPNEALLHELLAWELRYARREGLRVGLLYLAFDDWPDGGQGGLLQEALARIRAGVRESDVCARLAGAEFVLLAPRLRHPADASRLANAVREALLHPVPMPGGKLKLSASLGISLYPDDGDTAVPLLARARLAMLYSRRTGPGGFAFYTPACEA
ncbi:GGDEF domain-containing protein [Alkalilimnicola sp. S0819]|uniref:GGDEF domain-containing protein n=1 Tax=Alkalilimnicola sp. S0819 TaxID=2613922 RepID=UPI001261E5C8|nr:GGDEF domain-containing protein [Alkalilimnicola sp. S0819]KAB7623702.1 GGDEF domain-containing protein [Alkalilimnicola sp. S0819]MPQ16831.1 diguanylate cyclase [Alkalilimnicola sp. S0819]